MCQPCGGTGSVLAVTGVNRDASYQPCPRCSPRRCLRHTRWLASCADCTAFWLARLRP